MTTALLPDPGSLTRTRIRRLPDKAVTDRTTLHGILDAGLVAHIAVADVTGPHSARPYAIPVAYARDRDAVLFHGSSASTLVRLCALGSPVCFTVTLLGGLALARSAFDSPMNYRGVMVHGHCSVLHGRTKLAALEKICEHLAPGRWREVPPPSEPELRATTVLELPLEDTAGFDEPESAAASRRGCEDAASDTGLPAWAGTVPLGESWCDPAAALDPVIELASVPEHI
jgi:nitroimidazol reductase NimA-like FMN-containing flavoprotein (pyridoxamine 5'-phosphate oxidase superfamily)